MVVVKKPGAEVTREELLAFYEGKTAKWQIPDDVVFVDAIPLGATGKMQKIKLRELLKDYKLPRYLKPVPAVTLVICAWGKPSQLQCTNPCTLAHILLFQETSDEICVQMVVAAAVAGCAPAVLLPRKARPSRWSALTR